jgi:hypothetical protein
LIEEGEMMQAGKPGTAFEYYWICLFLVLTESRKGKGMMREKIIALMEMYARKAMMTMTSCACFGVNPLPAFLKFLVWT